MAINVNYMPDLSTYGQAIGESGTDMETDRRRALVSQLLAGAGGGSNLGGGGSRSGGGGSSGGSSGGDPDPFNLKGQKIMADQAWQNRMNLYNMAYDTQQLGNMYPNLFPSGGGGGGGGGTAPAGSGGASYMNFQPNITGGIFDSLDSYYAPITAK